MPIYEYECGKCGHGFEREQRMADPPVKTCPECRSRRVSKLISRSSFVLKGGGWYKDGYSDPSAKKDASDEKPKEAASSSDDSGSSSKDEKKSSDSSAKTEKNQGGNEGKKKKEKKASKKSAT